MGNPDRDAVTINDTSKLTKDISLLYLNKKFSDITIIVDKETISAHKVILAARSTYFESLLYNDGQENSLSELQLSLEVSPESVRNILKFLYTGTISIHVSNIDATLDLITLANQWALTDLKQVLAKKVKTLLNLKNICSVLNTATLNDLTELKEACLSFMDRNTPKILANDCFEDLTQKSLIKLLERDTFFAPEIDIFKSVARWCQNNNDVGDLVIKSVRLSWLSVVDVVSTVWPTKLVASEDLLQAIAEIVEVKPRITKCRGKLVKDVNVATSEYQATVITGTKTAKLLTGNRDRNFFAEAPIGNKDGITVKFGFPLFINHIHMLLWDHDYIVDKAYRFYQYYIEVSFDQKSWIKVIDYQKYACRSVQKLYFEKQIVQYIRIVGTHNSANPVFHLVFFEAYFKETIPRLVNGIVVPTVNVATPEWKAEVVQGTNGGALLDGVTSNRNNFTWHTIGAGSIIVQLAQPFMLSSIKLLLWDGDARFYKYYVETSVNKSEWTVVADHKNEESKSWQVLRFLERPVSFIRITGTFNSANNVFHLLHLECPASDDLIKTY